MNSNRMNAAEKNRTMLLSLVPDAGGTVHVPLTQNKVARVDAKDLPLIAEYKWHAHMNGHTSYAETKVGRNNGGRTILLMHRLLLKPPPGFEIDHIDGDGLNNTRVNLRPAKHTENIRNQRLSKHNTTGFKGVTFFKRTGKFRAQIEINGQQRYLGYYTTAEAAHAAYCEAAIKYHGEFARLA